MTMITKNDVTVPVTVQTRTALPPDRACQPAVALSVVFKGWGPFPAVRGVRNQTGAWDHVGVSRNPILSDGSMATEKLTDYTPGHSFSYEVTGFTNYGLGADELIDYTTQRFEDVTRSIDVVLDTIGGDIQERSWQVLKKGGILVSLVQPPSENKAKEHGVRGIRLGARANGRELAEIAKIVDAGKLAPVIDRILPLSEARRAHELSQSGHTRGKIVLRVKNGDGTSAYTQSIGRV